MEISASTKVEIYCRGNQQVCKNTEHQYKIDTLAQSAHSDYNTTLTFDIRESCTNENPEKVWSFALVSTLTFDIQRATLKTLERP